jgi:hypothetical protein
LPIANRGSHRANGALAQWRIRDGAIGQSSNLGIKVAIRCGPSPEFQLKPHIDFANDPMPHLPQCDIHDCVIAPMRHSPDECPDWQSSIAQ